MGKYLEIFLSSFSNYGNYIWNEITFQTDVWYVNYFWMLTALSFLVWGLEVFFPWRKNQKIIRKDFWLDAFYMYFNFYIFKLIIFTSFSAITAVFFSPVFGEEVSVNSISKIALFDMSGFSWWLQLIIFFVALDFVQWLIHNILHRVPFLWEYHKVHHSVEEMGFAAHLRFHWMENVIYTPAKYIMLMLIGGFEPEQAFLVYYISIVIGHLNHANINITYGPFKYLLNNPAMHIWHHAKEMPSSHKQGMNFGISLSIWDYIFKTAYIPKSGRDIELGFDNIKKFPKTFVKQLWYRDK
jgi:sterol desaturase/sphingolipid hydroxylase (fatty acid hydroxylase superfamily)